MSYSDAVTTINALAIFLQSAAKVIYPCALVLLVWLVIFGIFMHKDHPEQEDVIISIVKIAHWTLLVLLFTWSMQIWPLPTLLFLLAAIIGYVWRPSWGTVLSFRNPKD